MNSNASGKRQEVHIWPTCPERTWNTFPHVFYVDDGFSGMNFARPGFQELLDDVEHGMINMVITKDLSRLGRDYIMTGYYSEIYCPSKGVRYIAVTDHFDYVSLRPSGSLSANAPRIPRYALSLCLTTNQTVR